MDTEIKAGDKGSYSLFSNLEVVEINQSTVKMKDRSGNIKEVYRDLFDSHWKPNPTPKDTK